MKKDYEDIEILQALARTGALLTKDKGRQGGLKGSNFVISCLYEYENNPNLGKLDCSINQSKIAEASGITPQSAGSLLSSLEDKGLIKRIPSETDRRAMKVELTDSGRKEALKVRKEQESFSKEALSCFNETEKRQLLDLLNKLSNSLADKLKS